MTGFPQRAPGAGECVRCGYAPAIPVVFRRQTGAVVVGFTATERGSLCRSCATAVYRRFQNRTLLLGWWAPWSFVMSFFVLFRNARQMRRVRALPEPWTRDPSVVAPQEYPEDPGPPLVRRGGFWLVALFLAAVVGSNVLIALGLY